MVFSDRNLINDFNKGEIDSSEVIQGHYYDA